MTEERLAAMRDRVARDHVFGADAVAALLAHCDTLTRERDEVRGVVKGFNEAIITLQQERDEARRHTDEQVADKHRILCEYQARVQELTEQRDAYKRERDEAWETYYANHG